MMMMMIFTKNSALVSSQRLPLATKDTHRNTTLESFSRFRRFGGVCFAILILEEFGRKKKSREVIARVESSPIEESLRTRDLKEETCKGKRL